MEHTNINIVNAFTNLDQLMQGNGPLMLMNPKEMFEAGQFYQWAKPLVDNPDLDLNACTVVPEEFEWVIGETQGW